MNEQLLRDFRPLLVSKITKGSPDKSSWDLPCVSSPAVALGREQSSGTLGRCMLQEEQGA